MRDEEEDGIVREETSILKEGTKGGRVWGARGTDTNLKEEGKKGRKTDRRWVHLMMSDRFDVAIHPSSIIWLHSMKIFHTVMCGLHRTNSGVDKPGNTCPSMHCSTWAFKHHFNQCLRSVQRNKIVAVNSIYWVLLSTSLLLTACPLFFFQLCIFPFFFFVYAWIYLSFIYFYMLFQAGLKVWQAAKESLSCWEWTGSELDCAEPQSAKWSATRNEARYGPQVGGAVISP